MFETDTAGFVRQQWDINERLDGRELDECRNLQIYYGTDYGSCQVTLGATKVLAQVTCDVQQPTATRPNEGILYVNVDFTPMGAAHFEVGRPTELAIQVNRLLEKCIKDSHCVDLESLCIASEEKVWALRIDVNILNHEGSLIDAASIAALAALAHFRRPDVTTTGEQMIIHDASERDPIPLTMYHYPICLTYALFNGGKNFVADPTYTEERVSEAQVVYGINSYRELCALHLGGFSLLSTDVVLRCASKAAARAAAVVTQIKEALAIDSQSREKERAVGFVKCVSQASVFAQHQAELSISLSSMGLRKAAKHLASKPRVTPMEVAKEEEEVTSVGNGTAELIGPSDGIDEITVLSSSEEDEDEDFGTPATEVKIEDKRKEKEEQAIELSGDSEEETTVTLRADEMNLKKKKVEKREKPMLKKEKVRRKGQNVTH